MQSILFIVTKGEVGGAQKFVKEQIEIATDAGYKCFLATNFKGWLSDAVEERVDEIFFSPFIESRTSIKYLIKLRSFIKKNNIGLVVCNSANGGLYGRLAAYICGIKSIYVSHGWSSVYNGGRLELLLNLVERGLALVSSSVLCVSENDYRIAKTKIKISEKRLKHISNSIFSYGNSQIAPSEMTNTPIKIVAVCRISHPKRLDLLTKAVSLLPNVHLTIIGDGSKKEELKELIGREQITNVTLVGEIPFFRDFQAFDIFALISDSEGLPLSALEAMSSGLALLLSNVGGCPELVAGNGELVENNAASIAAGINGCVNNLQKYKKRSWSYFIEKYDLETNRSVYLNYYQSIINN